MKRFVYRWFYPLYLFIGVPCVAIVTNTILIKITGQIFIQWFDITSDHFYPQILYVTGIFAWVNGATVSGVFLLLVKFIAHKEDNNVH